MFGETGAGQGAGQGAGAGSNPPPPVPNPEQQGGHSEHPSEHGSPRNGSPGHVLADKYFDVLERIADRISAPAPESSAAPLSSLQRVRTRAPDAFSGTDPELLTTFVMQLQLNFDANPQLYNSDLAKITFALSYLKDLALAYFQPFMGKPLDERPEWYVNYESFLAQLRDKFGPYDEEGRAESDLTALTMAHDSRISTYIVKFNQYASRIYWDDAALRHRFYSGLPTRIKDRMAISGKPDTLSDMIHAAQRYDNRYWEYETERKRQRAAQSGQPRSSNSNSNQGSSNSGSGSQSQSGRQNQKSNSNNSGSSSSKTSSGGSGGSGSSSGSGKPAPAKLGPDGKLTPEERQRRIRLNLCLFCAKPGHRASECPRSTSHAAKARASQASTAAPAAAPAAAH